MWPCPVSFMVWSSCFHLYAHSHQYDKAHTTLWEEHNLQSPECSPLSATTFLCQNTEDSIPAFPFHLHPGEVKFCLFLWKELRREGWQFIMIQAFKHTQQDGWDSQWCIDPREFLVSGFESRCNPQNYAEDFRSIQDLITSSLPPKSQCRLHRAYNPWNIWCLPQVPSCLNKTIDRKPNIMHLIKQLARYLYCV